MSIHDTCPGAVLTVDHGPGTPITVPEQPIRTYDAAAATADALSGGTDPISGQPYTDGRVIAYDLIDHDELQRLRASDRWQHPDYYGALAALPDETAPPVHHQDGVAEPTFGGTALQVNVADLRALVERKAAEAYGQCTPAVHTGPYGDAA